jgi:peptide deformylase
MSDGASQEIRTLDVIRLGHPTLRQVADPVPEELFGSGWLHDLSLKMVRTMTEQEGVGLAGPQVAEALRLFVYWVPEDDDHPGITPTLIVNPEIRPIGADFEDGWEGCLSIPGLRGVVPRHRRIKVKARTLEGDSVSLTANGFHARVIQHETDHLDGVVFLDRMTDMASLAYEREWEHHVLGLEEQT